MSSGGKGQDTSAQNKLADLSQQLVNETGPVRTEALGQGLEGLKTGGIGAMIPLITNAVTQSKAALSNTLQNTQARLGSTGLARSPFGQSVLGGLEMQGNQQIAGIGPTMNMQFLSQLLGPAFGQPATGISGLSSAAGAQASQNVAQTGLLSNVLGNMIPNVALRGTLPSFGAAAGSAGAGMTAGATSTAADEATVTAILTALAAAGGGF